MIFYAECSQCGEQKNCPPLFFERIGRRFCLACACDLMQGKPTDEVRTLEHLLTHLEQAQKIAARCIAENKNIHLHEDMRLVERRLLIVEDEMRLRILNLRKEEGA